MVTNQTCWKAVIVNPDDLSAVHRRGSNCQTGTGTDSPRRLVDSEECWLVGTKKRGVTPSLIRSSSCVVNQAGTKHFADSSSIS